MLVLQYVLGAMCLLLALWLLGLVVADRPPAGWVDGALAVIEAGLVVQLVLGVVRVGGAPAEVSVVTYVGYLVGSLLILPAAWIWAQAERSRSGLGVLVVGLLVVPFLFLRLHQVWAGGA